MIQAQALAATENKYSGDRLLTIKATFPRYILAELNTHRMFSRNSASSRAIPSKRMIKNLQENPFIPVAWQKDHTGMQGTEYIEDTKDINLFKEEWLRSRDSALESSSRLNGGILQYIGNVHKNGTEIKEGTQVTKQITNRLLEPFMWHTAIVSSTEWQNFFNLRCPKYEIHEFNEYGESIKIHTFKSKKEALNVLGPEFLIQEEHFSCGLKDRRIRELFDLPNQEIYWLKLNKGQADIHIMALAEAIYDVYTTTNFNKEVAGYWHLPFGDRIDERELTAAVLKLNPQLSVPNDSLTVLSWDTMLTAKIMVSSARCARVSYETFGDNPKIDYEADLLLYKKLYEGDPHLSPFEHPSKVMSEETYNRCLKTVMVNGSLEVQRGWLNNYRGFIQQRALIEF